MKTKIFVICHEPCPAIKNDVYESICVGKNKDLFEKDFLRDDVGENISDLNIYFNELTAIYWIYKHIDEYKDIDNIGFVHYRRFFIFDECNKFIKVAKKLDRELIEVSNNQLDSLFEEADFALPYLNYTKSVKAHFLKAHPAFDLDVMGNIIKQKYPGNYGDFLEYFAGNKEFLYNMFIAKKDVFIKYCDFIFDVLFEYKKQSDLNDRLYISERLTGIFFTNLIKNGYKCKEMPVLLTREKDLSKGVKTYKKNSKEHKEYGFVYKTKSIWLNLMPISLEQSLRNKTRRKAHYGLVNKK